MTSPTAPINPFEMIPLGPPAPGSNTTTKALNDFHIFVSTPHSYTTIFKEWFAMYEQLIKPASVRLYMDPNLPLDVNRNNAVREALKDNAEYILFIDHDNILDPNSLVRMLEQNVPIIGQLYFERKYPYLPVCYTFEDDYQTVRVAYNYPKGKVRVDVIGLGCSLFNMQVFKEIPEPWFCYEYKDVIWGTEDIGFFHKVKDKGIPVIIDTEHTVGHLTTHQVTEEDWLRCKDPYLAEVSQKAKELGTTSVFLDKTKGILKKSPSAKD